jgi:2-polyprenyl-3-methyl-5-hydroxy-6-metoxy-1,4-benzoquinol methylase
MPEATFEPIHILERTLAPSEYVEYYQRHAEWANKLWENIERPEYEADVWYNLNRNDICLNMLGDICDGKKVIDLGCGYWPERELISHLKAYVTLVDIAGKLIGDDVVEADACHTPFPDKSYDVVICRELLEHVIDADALMAEIRRLLRAGGYLLLSTPNGFNIPPMPGGDHLRAYSPQSLLDLMDKFHFNIIDKRGNVPNIFFLIPLAALGMKWVLSEFKKIAERFDKYKDSYYVGTCMHILAQK